MFFGQTFCYAYAFPLQFFFIFENSTSGVISYKLYSDWSASAIVPLFLGAPSLYNLSISFFLISYPKKPTFLACNTEQVHATILES